MRHIISILLQNEAGALARVAAMFSSRGYNIDSLSVAPTHDPSVSRLTLVTSGSDAVIEQIIKQTRKLIDVVEIADLSSDAHVECELVMLKLKLASHGDDARAVQACVSAHRAAIVDESGDTCIAQHAGTGPEIDAFVAAIGRIATIRELVRSGVAALQRGSQCMRVPGG
jgi:acetolactate synthase-1/3 small subunit